MAKTIIKIEMDASLKKEFEYLCNTFGMSMSTAINVFARAVVKERKIPFEITALDIYSEENTMKVFNKIRDQAKTKGINDMSMEEIDEEISRARRKIGE